MKIALVIEQMDPFQGGREVSTSQIAAGLARRGHEVTVLCRRANWSCPGVKIQAVPAGGLTRTGKFRRFAAGVAKFVQGCGFDAVHAVAPVPCATVYQPRGGTYPGSAAARLRCGGGGALRQRVLGPLNFHRTAMAEMERQLVASGRVVPVLAALSARWSRGSSASTTGGGRTSESSTTAWTCRR